MCDVCVTVLPALHRSLESDKEPAQINTDINCMPVKVMKIVQAVVLKSVSQELSGARIKKHMPTFGGTDLIIFDINSYVYV